MKLLFDEMLPAAVAVAMRANGFDVVAVTEHDELRGMSDEEVFGVALIDGRAMVTDNVADFLPLHDDAVGDGRRAASIVAITSSALNRNSRAFTGELVRALTTLWGEDDNDPDLPRVWFI